MNPLSTVLETLREQVASIQEQHVFSPALLNTARVGFSRAGYYFTGATPVPLQLREEKDFRLDPNELADLITDRTKLIVLNSPHNPTGSVVTEQDVKDIAAAIGDRDIMVLSDEIYSRLIFEGRHHSLMSLPGWRDRVILLDGWSKTYAMTGWRLGYGVMRKDLAAHFGRLMTNVNSCSAAFTFPSRWKTLPRESRA